MAVTALNFAGLTIPPAAAINAAASPRTLSGAGARALIPLTYGPDRVDGLILNVLLSTTGSSTLLVQVLWGHACNAIGTLRLNDQVLSGGSSVTSYTGSQVTADSALVTAFAAQGITYSEALTGYAYSVIAMPVREFEGQLNYSALIEGRKLYDPRLDSTNGGSGSHRLATPSTWAYSTNPSLALADWLYSTLYGAGETVLWSSVITAANANDALIGSPSETHRKIGVTFKQGVQVPDMAEALRAYAGVWLVPTSAGVKLLPDATASSVATYAHASGQIAAIDALTLRDLGNSPTAVEVVYTDISQVPYREGSAIAQRSGAGTTLPWRLSTVRLPGIQRYGQALREATERLNKLYLSDLSTTLEVFDGGMAHEPGDVITVSHPVGLVSKLFRVTVPQMAGPGRWRLSLAEYDPAVYSTSVATGPTYTDAGLDISDGRADSEILNSYVPTGINLVYNSAFEAGLDGWTTGAAYLISPTAYGVNLSNTWRLAHPASPWTSVFWVAQGGTYSGNNASTGNPYGTLGACFDFVATPVIPVIPGKRYVLSAYQQAHRCTGVIFERWYTSAGTLVSAEHMWCATVDNEQANAQSLETFDRPWASYVAPATAAYVVIVIRKYDTFASPGVDSYQFVTRLQFEEVMDDVTTPSAWSDGARQHTINAGNVASYITAGGVSVGVDALVNPSPISIGSSDTTKTTAKESVVSIVSTGREVIVSGYVDCYLSLGNSAVHSVELMAKLYVNTSTALDEFTSATVATQNFFAVRDSWVRIPLMARHTPSAGTQTYAVEVFSAWFDSSGAAVTAGASSDLTISGNLFAVELKV